MIFRIIAMNKSLDMYNVMCDTGEQQCVKAYQIVQVMLQGYVFDNAKLTKKGFAVNTDKGTRYVQVDGLPKSVYAAIANKLMRDKSLVEETKKQMTQAIQATPVQQPTQQKKTRVKASSLNNIKGNITGNKGNQVVHYKGQVFLSDEKLCAKFNRDVNTYRKLIEEGYSMDEALGLKPLREAGDLISKSNMNKILDSMEAKRGGY